MALSGVSILLGGVLKAVFLFFFFFSGVSL